MSNTEQIVSVPREELQRFIENAACLGRSPQWVKDKAALLNAIAQPAAQHQGEPVAYIRQKDIDRLLSAHVAGCSANLEKEPRDGFVPFFAHPDAGEVERLREELEEHQAKAEMFYGKQQLAETRLKNAENRLAERDALLRVHTDHVATLCDVMFRHGLGMEKEAEQKIYAALRQQQLVFSSLSASAEPSAPKCETCSDHGAVGNILNAEPCPDCSYSAPVERDERAEFESWVSTRKVCTHKGATLKKDRAGNYLDYRINDRWLTWQSRAALECKP